MSDRERIHTGQLVGVEHLPIEGREHPYEFIVRMPAVTVLPIVTREDGSSEVLTVDTTRLHYGTIHELPGGNADGTFENPESARATAEREMGEEIGYAAAPDDPLEAFLLQPVSTTILYDRQLVIARNPEYRGIEIDSAHERVVLAPTPLDEYLDGLIAGDLRTYPELVVAFSRAQRQCGRWTLTNWLTTGAHQAEVYEAFAPWMTPIPAEN